jgi:outer membrane receptor for ferrienterochelin and colicins
MTNFFILLMLLVSAATFAVDIKGKVVDQKGEPIPGVHVFWLAGETGTVSDANGGFSITKKSHSDRLIFSNVAFRRDTIQVAPEQNYLSVTLREVIELSEHQVVHSTSGTLKSRFSIQQTERITGHELTKAACCNLSESFETNPSVDVAYSDAATGAKQIRLLGLSGTYVQMLTENIPNLRGISSIYGMSFIPGPWIEGIQLSKGTGSVINGYEALTGQINVEYKKPHLSETIFANMFASDAGRVEANVNAALRLNHDLSTGIMLHASDEFMMLDTNGDGYMDMPKVQQRNILNRWFFNNGHYTFQAFLKGLSEKRTGGTIDQRYKISIETERYEFFLKNGYVFNHDTETSIGWIVSGAWHNQLGVFGNRMYDGLQKNLYSNLIFQTNFSDHHKLSTGLTVNYDHFDERLMYEEHLLSSAINTGLPFQKEELVAGAFAEYSIHLHDQLIGLAGFRADHSSLYGTFFTPRLHLKYMPWDHLHLRTTIGKAYRSPHMLAENNNYLASNRRLEIAMDLPLEEAWNYGISAMGFLPLWGRELTLSGEWYFTDFQKQVVVDVDQSPHSVYFYALNGPSYAHSIQFEANMELVKGWTMTLAHRINDVKTTINGELRDKPLTSKYKGMATTSYTTPLKKWQFDFTAQFNGGGRLPDPDPLNPLWAREFNDYTILNSQLTRFFRTWSVYAGVENLTNFVQENPIIDVANPFSTKFDATNIWGPTHGRKLYVGFRWCWDRD